MMNICGKSAMVGDDQWHQRVKRQASRQWSRPRCWADHVRQPTERQGSPM